MEGADIINIVAMKRPFEVELTANEREADPHL